MKVRIGGELISDVELLDSYFSKMKGLMFKEEGRALLKFDVEDKYGVWMPFMKYPLDLAFISKELEVVTINEDVKPISLSPKTWRIYRPDIKCKYILEVESGLLQEKGVKIGDKVEFC